MRLSSTTLGLLTGIFATSAHGQPLLDLTGEYRCVQVRRLGRRFRGVGGLDRCQRQDLSRFDPGGDARHHVQCFSMSGESDMLQRPDDSR